MGRAAAEPPHRTRRCVWRPGRAVRTLAEVLERVAEHGTTVLVFEDLPWADPGLLDFVESLLDWSRTSPVIVLSLARPELSDRSLAWGSGVRSSSTLHLDPLADPDIETMVTGYVDGLPDDGLARLVSRAEGVPMYAVETVYVTSPFFHPLCDADRRGLRNG